MVDELFEGPIAWIPDTSYADDGISLDEVFKRLLNAFQRSGHSKVVHLFRWNSEPSRSPADLDPGGFMQVLLIIGLEWENGISRANSASIHETSAGIEIGPIEERIDLRNRLNLIRDAEVT